MNYKPHYLSYQQTGAFSRIVSDYINNASSLQAFYKFKPDIEGIKQAIIEKKNFPDAHRKLLVEQLEKQYSSVTITQKVKKNISSLLNSNTYTVCTAHQPNIFTGHLYFIYKIVHVIKLADELSASIKDASFVPVFYMGTEDADLIELGQITIAEKKIKWDTSQTGAVGRMKVDESFITLIDELEGQLSIYPFGNEILALTRKTYTIGKSIEQATFEIVNELFAHLGLIILLPDNPELKKIFIPVMEKELKEQFSGKAVAETIATFPKEYKVQASGRSVNLFYLDENRRDRIETNNEGFIVSNSETRFTSEEIIKELHSNPERFSPNVILRPLYQEMILPNIAFIGGGGELAYWLELHGVFKSADLPFPVLILRNSFMLINESSNKIISSLGISEADIFMSEDELIKNMVEKGSGKKLKLEKELSELHALYQNMEKDASAVDSTLKIHVASLSVQAINKVKQLEKKMLSAEKKRFETQQRQIQKLRRTLFPGGVLQERSDNLLPYYSIYGVDFIDTIYNCSTGMKQEFCVIKISDSKAATITDFTTRETVK
ncbi:MAG: bacillithiol biosynthesis cysteine-adding enzyme BshC [Ferruginibacter sp.]